MAFAFGDSYLKLPPISKESSVEIDGENSKSASGIVRDKHGVVRLPPIVRLDSLRSASSAARLRDETQKTAITKHENDSEHEMARLGSPLKISNKMESLRHGSSKKLRKYTEKREDEMKLIKDPAAKETNEDGERFFDGEDTPHGQDKASRFRSLNEELMPLCRDSVMHRRGSSTFQTSGKLTRSRRLAKSSPELSNRKINLRLLADGAARESSVSSLTAGLSPASRSRIYTQPRLSVHDIDGSVLSHLQNAAKSEEKSKEYGKRRGYHSNHRCQNEETNQPKSTPSSPVCSESANKAEIKQQKGRKSLNDITDTQQFTDRGRPSLKPKKQNLIHDAEVLKIEGKSCPQNERETQQDVRAANHTDTLHPPQHSEKRHSLYDLEQILTLLQREDLKRQISSPAASASKNTSATSNASDKTFNASVYDLREFLVLASAEKSNAGQMKKTTTNKLDANKAQTTSSHLLRPVQERENARDDRKGSVYDIMEFLSLGGIVGGETGSGATSENSSRAPSPRILLSPRNVPGSNDFLSVAKRNEEGRRSSTYDLMEFLSLSRSGTSSRSDSGQSSPALHVNEPRGLENEESEVGRPNKETRSLSVYDLAEFLSMNSDVPPFVRVTPSNEEQTEGNTTDSGAGVRNDFHKPRESVYDLREMLGVMQQEHERKRESTYNLQEMLSYFQREADADESSQFASASAVIHSVNSLEKDTPASPSPPKTASSGYSTASDTVSSTLSAKSLDTNDNNRQMSVYDLREFLSLYAAQQIQSLPANQQLTSAVLRRKFSNVSQSGVTIHVTDESNRSVHSELCEDVFLPVPGAEAGPSDSSRKRSSIYDLREFLNILNADESPLRRRLSSVSSNSSKSSESEPESSPYANSVLKSDTNSAASNFGANENNTASRPQLSPRQDSGGSVSLYDLGEFLSLLNTDEAPLRRRLSSASDIIASQGGDIRVRTPVLSRSDSEKGLYSLEEILTVMNDLEQKRINENASGEFEADSGEEISIQVPTLPPKTDKTNTQPFSARKLLQSQRSLKSVPETSEVKTSPLSNSF